KSLLRHGSPTSRVASRPAASSAACSSRTFPSTRFRRAIRSCGMRSSVCLRAIQRPKRPPSSGAPRRASIVCAKTWTTYINLHLRRMRQETTMPEHRDVFVLGGFQTDFARNYSRENKDIGALMEDAVEGALANCEIEAREIETAHVGNFASELFCNQGIL